MKRRIIVEIDCPEGFDAVWDEDHSGIQVFSDTVQQLALQGASNILFDTLLDLKNKGIEENYQEDRYYKFIKQKVDITNGCQPIGYVDEENRVHLFNRKEYKWEPPVGQPINKGEKI